MTDEVLAAADSLRKSLLPLLELHGWHESAAELRTVLAEHPSDDNEPVEAGWWGNTFDTQHVELSGCFLLYLRDDGHIALHAEGPRCDDSVYTLTLEPIKTRGDVRRLCRVLGIELKEKLS